MGSLPPVSWPDSWPFLKPATKMEPIRFRRLCFPNLHYRRVKRPTPQFQRLTAWLKEPPNLQARIRWSLLRQLGRFSSTGKARRGTRQASR